MENKRKSNIELLKIIAILLVVISHTIPYGYSNGGAEYVNIEQANSNVFLQLVRYLGQIGNVVFIICSAWFLVDKEKVKLKKVIYIIVDCFIISVICCVIIKIMGYPISLRMFIKQLFPITFSNNWFIGCYISFYLMVPFFNIIVRNLNQKRFFRINVVLIFFDIWQMFKENRNIYNYLIGFVIIYFLVAYIKKFNVNKGINVKKSIVVIIGSFICLLCFTIIYNKMGHNINGIYSKMQYFTNIKNPLIFVIAIMLFNIFEKITITNKRINYISSTTLLIYIIHDNYLIRNFIKKDIFQSIYLSIGYNYINVICLLLGLASFAISLIMGIIYKETVQKINYKMVDEILFKKVKLIYLNIENKILNISRS